jgi:hypothetical protein
LLQQVRLAWLVITRHVFKGQLACVPLGIAVASLTAHREEGMLWFEQQSEGGSKVMVLPWGLEMVCHRQIMHCPAHSPHNYK